MLTQVYCDIQYIKHIKKCPCKSQIGGSVLVTLDMDVSFLILLFVKWYKGKHRDNNTMSRKIRSLSERMNKQVNNNQME